MNRNSEVTFSSIRHTVTDDVICVLHLSSLLK